jgi:hypothetical protein
VSVFDGETGNVCSEVMFGKPKHVDVRFFKQNTSYNMYVTFSALREEHPVSFEQIFKSFRNLVTNDN